MNGKEAGLKAISNEQGIIFATAMDQRGSVGKMMQSFNSDIEVEPSLKLFKQIISEELGQHSDSLLLDPEYGWEGAEVLHSQTGLIMAYEKTGYDATEKGRLPNLVDYWAIQDLKKKNVSAVKLLVYYDHEEEASINRIKQALIKRTGDECRQNDMLFILEPVSYSHEGFDSKGPDFAKRKPAIIDYFMEEFSKPEYGVDLLKVEVPVSIFHIEGYCSAGEEIFTKEESLEAYNRASDKSNVPFIYLSGGVTNEQFIQTLYFAKEAKAAFSGVLCGRATWQEGIETFSKQGAEELRKWLQEKGADNLNSIKEAVYETATTPARLVAYQ